MSIEAMKQALEALVEVKGWQSLAPGYVLDEVEDAITALRQAIEQTEKQDADEWFEKALWGEPDTYGDGNVYRGQRSKDSTTKTLHYTAQPEAEKQKPVACQHKRYTVDEHEQTGTCYDCGAQGRMRFIVNETAPPKREWQGLTDEDIARLRMEGAHSVSDKDFRAIEAKLKEKNT